MKALAHLDAPGCGEPSPHRHFLCFWAPGVHCATSPIARKIASATPAIRFPPHDAKKGILHESKRLIGKGFLCKRPFCPGGPNAKVEPPLACAGCGCGFQGIRSAMTITVTADQKVRLNALVASGDFASVEEAARTLLDERLAGREIEDDDLAWAKPLVDEGLAALERGEFISLKQHKARNAARLAALKG